MEQMSDDSLRIDQREAFGVSVIEPHGVLDTASYRELRDSMLKAGVDESRAVIVNVDGLDVQDRAPLSVFVAAAERLEQWPCVPLLVAGGTDELWQRLCEYRLHRYVQVHRSVAAAAAAIDDPPPRRIRRRELPNSLRSASLARAFVRETCEPWRVGEPRCEDAVLVVNELVENTLLHTYCAPSVRVELRRDVLAVGVYDGDPTPPRRLDPDPAQPHRGGLAIVADVADLWGCSPTQSNGKVVWAVLRLPKHGNVPE
jgi:anti-anti-sigma regulatory factor